MTPETWAAVEILLWLGGIATILIVGVIITIYNMDI
tara:strand:+ start:361 stop:468 length:108 start_codon:yes stop_codon:yes gene_type:complete